MSLISLLGAAALACQPVAGGGPVGFWEATATSTGGIGDNIELRENGSYSRAMTVMVDFVYEFEDGVLYVQRDLVGPVLFEEGSPVELTDSAYVLEHKDGSREVRTRISAFKKGELSGVYNYRHYAGGIAYEKFTADGLFHFRMPMRVVHGCYAIDGDKLELSAQGEATQTVFYEIEDGLLRMQSGGRGREFRLVPEGAWYHVDEIDYVKPKGIDPDN